MIVSAVILILVIVCLVTMARRRAHPYRDDD
jgi:hypothetical protein